MEMKDTSELWTCFILNIFAVQDELKNSHKETYK